MMLATIIFALQLISATPAFAAQPPAPAPIYEETDAANNRPASLHTEGDAITLPTPKASGHVVCHQTPKDGTCTDVDVWEPTRNHP